MHYDVGAVLEGTAEIGCSKGIIDDERQASFVGNLGNSLDVEDIPPRVADGLPIECACARSDSAPVVFRVAAVNKDGIDPPGAQGNVKLGVCASVKAAG